MIFPSMALRPMSGLARNTLAGEGLSYANMVERFKELSEADPHSKPWITSSDLASLEG